MKAINLDKLNDNQRAAVVFGVEPDRLPPPLLVIAGAGSGKTNTLAHRVAHLLVNGTDPRRILLMTFSRRASSELSGSQHKRWEPVMLPKHSHGQAHSTVLAQGYCVSTH